MKPWYIGPMVVIHMTIRGSLILAEVDGTLSKLWYMAKHLIPYNSCSIISGEQLSYLFNLSNEELYMMMHKWSDEAHVANGNSSGFCDDVEELSDSGCAI